MAWGGAWVIVRHRMAWDGMGSPKQAGRDYAEMQQQQQWRVPAPHSMAAAAAAGMDKATKAGQGDPLSDACVALPPQTAAAAQAPAQLLQAGHRGITDWSSPGVMATSNHWLCSMPWGNDRVTCCGRSSSDRSDPGGRSEVIC